MILEDGIYVLFMNDMRSPKFERLVPVCCSKSKVEIISFVESERVECYEEFKIPELESGPYWAKHHKKGGPLEWYNKSYKVLKFINDIGDDYGFAVASLNELKGVPEVEDDSIDDVVYASRMSHGYII